MFVALILKIKVCNLFHLHSFSVLKTNKIVLMCSVTTDSFRRTERNDGGPSYFNARFHENVTGFISAARHPTLL